MQAAFFDLDGTLYDGRIWQDLARHHWSTRRQRRWVVAYLARNMAPLPLYKLGVQNQDAFYGTWGKTMSWMLRGWTVEEGQALFEQLTEARILPNLRPQVLERLEYHAGKGHLVALVSGTCAPWLETVARRLGVHHAIGTPLEVRDGHYTGRILPPLCQGPGKPVRTRAYLEEIGLSFDWAGSFAYGDSGTDLHLLREVGQPVAVYPDKVLAAEAHARDWPSIGEAQT